MIHLLSQADVPVLNRPLTLNFVYPEGPCFFLFGLAAFKVSKTHHGAAQIHHGGWEAVCPCDDILTAALFLF